MTTLDKHEGDPIAKRNFGPVGTSEAEALRDPKIHLVAYTVMFDREAGHDPEDGDWFSVKCLPDGLLNQTPNGMAMAEQVVRA